MVHLEDDIVGKPGRLGRAGGLVLIFVEVSGATGSPAANDEHNGHNKNQDDTGEEGNQCDLERERFCKVKIKMSLCVAAKLLCIALASILSGNLLSTDSSIFCSETP